jgi:exopolyphosphatase/guanosine-5'-triphosphate,3'-diphosphate pyrophosphatase
MVIRNRPVDPEGRPFPTLYWLTCPDTVAAVSRLESEGWIARLNEQVEIDPELRAGLRRAHEAYARERGAIVAGAVAWGGVGGTARGIKCLHAHYAYFIAGGRDPVGGWVASQLAQGEPVHYEKPARRAAVVDLGTNSIRLLVARWTPSEDQIQELARDMILTRIGEEVDRTGVIAAEPLRRTLLVLARYCRRARALGAERIHLGATSAVREAANRDELADGVLKLTGEPMEVVSGEEEAALSFLGATRDLRDVPAPYLVLDIGGGSTEFVLGEAKPTHAISTRMGSVRLTERYVHSDPPSPENLDTLGEAVTSVLAKVEERMPVREARTLIAVAGTATTMQGIELALPEYDPEVLHRSWMTAEAADRVFRLLVDMTTDERRALPVMAPGREDVIAAGAAILVSVMHRWGFDRALVSETDILDGLLYRMIGKAAPPPTTVSP